MHSILFDLCWVSCLLPFLSISTMAVLFDLFVSFRPLKIFWFLHKYNKPNNYLFYWFYKFFDFWIPPVFPLFYSLTSKFVLTCSQFIIFLFWYCSLILDILNLCWYWKDSVIYLYYYSITCNFTYFNNSLF